jgi:hypothetical protein
MALGCSCLFSPSAALAQPRTPQAAPAQQAVVTPTVTATVQFRVFSARDYSTIAGARIIVINRDGRILQTGLTNAQGAWRATLTVPRDPRFGSMGVATAIAVANGYNENVVFDVPVKVDTVQPITLSPIVAGLRNEPSAVLGNLHRLDVIDLVNRYAKELGLQKQTPIPGEMGYAPWGPRMGARPSR